MAGRAFQFGTPTTDGIENAFTDVHRMVAEAFETEDVAKASALDDMDSYLDGLQRQFIEAIFECNLAGTIDLQVAIQLAVVARFYERIGDHAVNIGERILYAVSGWRPELKGAARHKARLAGDDTDGVPFPEVAPGT